MELKVTNLYDVGKIVRWQGRDYKVVDFKAEVIYDLEEIGVDDGAYAIPEDELYSPDDVRTDFVKESEV